MKTKTSGERTLTRQQINDMLGKITELKDLVLLKIAVNTGIRRDDIVSLKINDIDFENNKINFYEKKKKRIWSVWVSDSLMNYIKMLIKTYNREIYIFPSEHKNKKHISGKTAYNILQKYRLKIGIKHNLPFHTLRASFVKMAKDSGWSYEQLQRQTGDKEETLKKHYATPSEGEMKDKAKTGVI